MNRRYIKIRTKTVPFVFLCGILQAALAQPLLTEQDVVKQVLENNLSVESLELQKQQSILDAHNAQGQWLPRLAVRVKQDFTPLDSSSAAYGDSILGERKTSTSTGVGVNATQALPGGGSLSADVDVNRSETFHQDDILIEDFGDGPLGALDGPDYGNSWSLEYRQPLLRGAWGNDPVKHSIYIQRLDQQNLTLEQKRRIIEIISDSRNRYWDVFEKNALIDLYEKQRIHAKQRLDADRARLSIGRATPLDTLNAALSLMKAQTEIMRLRGEISLAKNQLANVLGRDTLCDSTHTSDSIDLKALHSSEQLLNQALEFDPQLKIFSIINERIVEEQRKARNDLLPQVDFSASYRRNARDSDLMGSGRSFDHNLVLSLIAEYSLPIRTGRNEIRSIELQLRDSRIQEKQRRDRIKLQIDELRTAWEQELRTLEILKKAKEVARKQLEASQEGYRLGTIDRLSLVDAENAFLSASIDLLRSQLTMKRTQILIEEVTGTVLPTFGVVLQ